MYNIIVQRAVPKEEMPSIVNLKRWAKTALAKKTVAAELTLRIVDVTEMTELNTRYRHKSGATNVLSFPFDMPANIDFTIPVLGDIVICADIVNREANVQEKMRSAHWAHMVIHGVLHLLGYDHEKEIDAIQMESEEIAILISLGFEDPYKIRQKGK